MTKIKDTEFINLFTYGDVGIDIGHLSDEAEKVLKQAGLDLSKIDDNKDGIIKGKKELLELFKAVDGFDVNGSKGDHSFSITDKNNLPTISGVVTETLVEEFKRNVSIAQMNGPLRAGVSNKDTTTTWFGDKGNSLVPKDGYLQFKGVHKDGLPDHIKMFPDHIKLAGGKEMRVKMVDDEFIDMRGGGTKRPIFELSNGREKLYAYVDDKGYMKFWEHHPDSDPNS